MLQPEAIFSVETDDHLDQKRHKKSLAQEVCSCYLSSRPLHGNNLKGKGQLGEASHSTSGGGETRIGHILFVSFGFSN